LYYAIFDAFSATAGGVLQLYVVYFGEEKKDVNGTFAKA